MHLYTKSVFNLGVRLSVDKVQTGFPWKRHITKTTPRNLKLNSRVITHHGNSRGFRHYDNSRVGCYHGNTRVTTCKYDVIKHTLLKS